MSSPAATDGFSHLFSLGLITGDEHDAVKTYGKPILIKPGATPAEHLVWMVEQHIVSHGRLLQKTDAEGGASGNGSYDERMNVLERALIELDSRAEALNATLLDELVSAGLISTIDRGLTLNQDFPYVLGSLGRALAHVVDSGVMTRERFVALLDKVGAERADVGRQAQVQVVEEAAVILQAIDMASESERAAGKRPGWRIALEVIFWIGVAIQIYGYIRS